MDSSLPSKIDLNPALKPCPFCGGVRAMLFGPSCNKQSAYDPTDRAHPIVRCMDCFGEVPGRDWDNKGDSARAKWNRRDGVTPETPVQPDPKVCYSDFATRPILYTDTVHGQQTRRDDLWAITTAELNRLTPPSPATVCTCPEVCKVCGGRARVCSFMGHRPESARHHQWHTCPPTTGEQ